MLKNRRKYLRIPTVLPIEFFVIDKDNKKITPVLEAFTSDISKGGICIFVNDIWWGFWDRFNFTGAVLSLRINLLFKEKTINTKARVIWIDKRELKDFNQHIIGLEFLDINKKDADILFRYAICKKYLPILGNFLLTFFIFISIFLLVKVNYFVKENKKLFKSYVDILEKSSNLKELLGKEEMTSDYYKDRLDEITKKISSLEYELYRLEEVEKSTDVDNILKLKKEIEFLNRQKEFFEKKIEEGKKIYSILKDDIDKLDKEKLNFSKKIIQEMYNWIKNRQDLISGLVLSYEGDPNLKESCFTYDQALAIIVFLIFEDKESAKKILDFYLNEIEKNRPIYNAYDKRGNVSEYIIHSGPNAWLGLATLNYIKKTNDKRYILIAKKIADFLSEMMDKEGGIRGGPKDEWFSTEHNLDIFGFFNLLYSITKEEKYLDMANKIKNWLWRYAYTSYGPPVLRGKGDSTIATDTYAVSISSLGPKELFSLNMNPDAIIDFAINNCRVEVEFNRNGNKIKVSGFDFAKEEHLPRGGIISCEWTSQMILSFLIMADYYKDIDKIIYEKYLDKALYYFNELQKMIIVSPSKFGRLDKCLPYASAESVDTGHGWSTPKGNSTGSLAATSYFLIAYFGYNPFKAEFLNISLKEFYNK